jgi:hypothetical protein
MVWTFDVLCPLFIALEADGAMLMRTSVVRVYTSVETELGSIIKTLKIFR